MPAPRPWLFVEINVVIKQNRPCPQIGYCRFKQNKEKRTQASCWQPECRDWLSSGLYDIRTSQPRGPRAEAGFARAHVLSPPTSPHTLSCRRAGVKALGSGLAHR